MNQQVPKPAVMFLMGPTAAGKTELAIRLQQRFGHFSLISVDSALVYKHLDIGTAKPSPDVLARYPHHLIDIHQPHQPYSASHFQHDAHQAITDSIQQGKTPLLVGGTMLYFQALQQGLHALPAADPDVRVRIEAQAAQHGWPHIHAQLAQVDSESAARIKPTDSQRLQRALEVYQLSGKSITQWYREQPRKPLPFTVHAFAVAPKSRDTLHQRIHARWHTMIAQGFRTEEDPQTLNPVLDQLPGVYSRWVEEVKEYVPSDKLLVHAAQDGWEPLCKFLSPLSPEIKSKCNDILLSGEPYPHVADKKQVQMALNVLHGITLVFKILPSAVALVVAWWWLRHRRG